MPINLYICGQFFFKMYKFYFAFIESIFFALKALQEKILRTILSLLGVSIGVFTIISIFAIVDTLQDNIKKSLSFLGSDVIYISRMAWKFDEETPWWKYLQRPTTNYREMKLLESRLSNVESFKAVAIYALKGNTTLKYQNSSINGAMLMGASYHYDKVADITIEEGRYFSETEAENGAKLVVLGAKLANDLLDNEYPLGKEIKIKGIKLLVVGVLKKQGQGTTESSIDNSCIIPYKLFIHSFSPTKWTNANLVIKGISEHDSKLAYLESEITAAMRSIRGLRPTQPNNFSINKPEMITDLVDGIIVLLKTAGTLISIFSLLIGGFGIANIMFVSVTERISIIGIQKALGAKNYFILLQFLFESLFLSIIGGTIGLILCLLLIVFTEDYFNLVLQAKHILQGLFIASIIGILAGILPASAASRLSPVEAIRR